MAKTSSLASNANLNFQFIHDKTQAEKI